MKSASNVKGEVIFVNYKSKYRLYVNIVNVKEDWFKHTMSAFYFFLLFFVGYK